MIKATKKDKYIVVDILSKSFEHNKSVNFLVGTGGNRMQRIRSLMVYSFLTCLDFGEIWISECECSCALVLYPHLKQVTLKTIARDIGLIFSAVGCRVFKVLRRERLIGNCYKVNKDMQQESEKVAYLWFIGTIPNAHGMGLGTAMMKELMERADRMKRPVYLETSTESNVAWYRKFGFELYNQVDLGYTLYFLRK